MSPQQLPSDQTAVLSLLLRQRKTYAQVAGMLAIEERAVRDRAYDAVVALGAQEGTSLLHTQRQEIGDYLLGQRDSLSHSTRSYLESLAGARLWAEEVRSQLQQFSATELPLLPGQQAAAVEVDTGAAGQPPISVSSPELYEQSSPASGTSPAPVSRRGGALLLGAIVVVIVVAVLIITSGGNGKSPNAAKSPTASTSTTTSQSPTATTNSGAASSLHVDNQLNLTSPEAGSEAKGIVEIASEGNQYAFYIVAEHLPPSKGFFYVAWLSNSQGQAEALGKAPSVTSNGRLQGAGKLPSNAGKYDRLILTKETSEHASSPGQIVLESSFSLKAKNGAGQGGSSNSTTTGG